MESKALAIANNDIVYLWWTYSEKIPNCLGFTIRRILKNKSPVALPAFVGFKPKKKNDQPPVKYLTTDYWPIQSYQWKDLFVPEETEVEYEIAPVTGTPGGKLKEIPGLAIRTNSTKATDTIGRYRVFFNRGIISTQSLAKKLPKGKSGTPSAGALRKHIGTPGDRIRANLSGEAITALTSLFDRARSEGGKCYCALYELTDPELIAALKNSKGQVEVILSNADSSESDEEGKSRKVYDGTNQDTRKELHKALGNALHDRLLAKGNYIGHNKFVVYVDKEDQAKAVLTGSTNWTPTGLCAQSNNILLIEDDGIASQYLSYWQHLRDDKAKQGPDFRVENATALPTLNIGADQGNVHVWFTPDTQQKTKPKNNPPTPPDMAEVFEAISGAKHGALFLLFSAGAPSILQARAEDIPILAEQFAKVFCEREKIAYRGIGESALKRLLEHSWPGNVRELKNAIESALVLSRDGAVRREFLPESVRAGAFEEIRDLLKEGTASLAGESEGPEHTDGSADGDARAVATSSAPGPATSNKVAPAEARPEGWVTDSEERSLREAEEAGRIRDALERSGGDKSLAAGILGWSRMTLYRKMRRLGIDYGTGRPGAA